MTPILLLEINEVPWRIIDRYSAVNFFPHVRQFFERAHQFTTVTVDTGELSPWVTWPTLHRGINNEAHGIKNLGQDPATYRGKSIWQEIREDGGNIGICGSLQSWPPINPGEGGFYFPDTFAHDEFCIPDYVNAIQKFNLSQVRKNTRVQITGMPKLQDIIGLVSSLFKSGITLKTCGRIAAQLLGEKFSGKLLGRRSIYQTVLFWDVFRKHFKPENPPDFSTFFSNHIAGVMHRYWCDIFPEDFPEFIERNRESREPLMHFSFKVLDDILAEVIEWVKDNPNMVVIFASSMGQSAIHRDQHEGFELIVKDLAKLMSKTRMTDSDYKPLIAMAPQVAVEILDLENRLKVRGILEEAYCGNNEKFIKVQEIGSSLSITVGTPALKHLSNNRIFINGESLLLADAGICKLETEAGTAYHIPEGAMAVYCGKSHLEDLNQSRAKVNADQLKDWMLRIRRNGRNEISSLCATST